MRLGGLPLHNPKRVFFIGDIHGNAVNLKSVLDKILVDFQLTDHIVFGGDLVNGMPNSAKVLEMINDLRTTYPGQIYNLRGNHEFMLISYCMDTQHHWMHQFGSATFASMKQLWSLETNDPETIRAELEDRGIWSWLSTALPYYETEDLICTHAPLNFNDLFLRGLTEYDENDEVKLLDRQVDLMWVFVEEDDSRLDRYIDKVRVCGHQYSYNTKPRIFKKRVFVDTGCGKKEDRPLSCVVFPGKKVIQSDD